MMRNAGRIGSSLSCLRFLTLLFKETVQHSTQCRVLSGDQWLDNRAVDGHTWLKEQAFDIKPFFEVALGDVEDTRNT